MSVEAAATAGEAATTAHPRRWRSRWLVAAASLGVATAVVAGAVVYHWRQSDPARQFALARQAIAAGRWDEVERRMADLDRDPAFAPHAHFLRGALLLEQRQHYGALEEFRHAVDHPELRLETLILSGEALYRAGRLQDAMGLLEQAVALDPSSLPALRWLASSYYDLGLNDATVSTLSRIAELDPHDPRPHRLMALMHKDFEDYTAAVDCYRESLRRSGHQPDQHQIRLELAECEIKQQQYEAALETLSGCAASAERCVKEAECHYALGRTEEAQLLLQQALDEDPAHLAGLLLSTTIALEQGAVDVAVETISRAVVAWPRDYTANFRLSQVLRRAGRDADADRYAKIAEEIKQVRLEFSELHEVADQQPANADVRYRLGVLANSLGRPDLARVWFRAALAINPAHGDTLRQLAGELPTGAADSVPSTTAQPAEPPPDGARKQDR
jgi:tetratricopeptide (TPR) repeat protein